MNIRNICAGLTRKLILALFPSLLTVCALALAARLDGGLEDFRLLFFLYYSIAVAGVLLMETAAGWMSFAAGMGAWGVLLFFTVEEVLAGVCHYLASYLEFFNPYYHRNLCLLEPWNTYAGSVTGSSSSLSFLGILLVWLGCFLVVRAGTLSLSVILLFISLGAVMSVGQVPESWYLPAAAVCIVGWTLWKKNSLSTGKDGNPVSSLLTAALVTALAAGAAFALLPLTEGLEQWTASAKIRLQSHIETLTERVTVGDSSVSTGINGGNLDMAGDLIQDGTLALTVTLTEKPSSSVYISGFTGSVYSGNQWNPVPEDVLTSETGLSAEEAWNLYGENWQEAGAGAVMGVTLEDAASTRFLYHPYGLLAGIQWEPVGDGWLRRDGSSQDSFGFSSLILTGSLSGWESLSDGLTGPEEDEVYGEFVRKWNLDYDAGELAEVEEWFFSNLSGDAETVAEKASWVRRLLASQARYTLSPGTVPEGEDFVSWFLLTNCKGYCMHFASAGTILLRMWGVPARYAEGYVVDADAFTQTDGGKWTAAVRNRNAHAWTEVWLPHLGWVPVEMTPGYSEEEEEPVVQVTEAETVLTETVPETESETERMEETESTPEAEPEDSPGTASEKIPENISVSESGTSTGQAEPSGLNPAPLLAAAAILAAVLLTLTYGRRRRAFSRRRSAPGNRRLSVRGLGKGILRQCVRRGAPGDLHFSDPDFSRKLSGVFTPEEAAELDRVRTLINREEFDREPISEEEYQEIYKCYISLEKSTKKHQNVTKS